MIIAIVAAATAMALAGAPAAQILQILGGAAGIGWMVVCGRAVAASRTLRRALRSIADGDVAEEA